MGSDLTACQLAEFLFEKGRRVTIAATEIELAADLPTTLQLRIIGRLEKNGVSFITGVKSYENITDAGLVIVNQTGNRQTLSADTFVPLPSPNGATGANQKWVEAAAEVYPAGDYAESLKLLHAVHDGASLGRKI